MELSLLSSLIVLIFFSRILGFIFTKYEYQSMIGEVLGGFLLGPMILGIVYPNQSLELFSDFGIIMIMLVAGMETNFSAFRKNIKGSIVVASLGVIATFVVVFFPLMLLDFGWGTSLFLAAILSNSAIEVCAGIFVKPGHPRLKAVVMGASFVDDIIAVFLLGIVASSVLENASLTPQYLIVVSVKLALFMIISMFFIAKLVDMGFDRIRTEEGSEKLLLTATFLLAFSFAILASLVGLHEVIGAYIAGLIVGKWGTQVGPMLKRRIAWNRMMDEINASLKAIFSPIFFGYMGVILASSPASSSNYILILSVVGLLIAFGFAGKYIGCGFGARISGFTARASFLVGTAMLGRGALEMILAKYALDKGVITPEIFTALILFVLITIIVAPMLYSYTERQWGEEIGD